MPSFIKLAGCHILKYFHSNLMLSCTVEKRLYQYEIICIEYKLPGGECK